MRNVMLPLDYVRMKKKDKKAKAESLLDKLGIYQRRNARPSELSGGQKQRVAIARALINDADILLCDEPTGALDSKTSQNIMELLVALNREGKTLIIVTHDDRVASYCNRICYMKDGVLEETKPEALSELHPDPGLLVH